MSFVAMWGKGFGEMLPNVTYGGRDDEGSKIGQKSVTYYLNGPIQEGAIEDVFYPFRS